jgi:dTDP-4-amino-4,6-dideoxygalactose transaminase
VIPRHKPPFGVFALLTAALFSRTSQARLETEYAHLLGVRHAILLPSARVGVYHFLRHHARSHQVIAPAYTCGVIHEAVVRSGIPFSLLDNAPDRLLPAEDAIMSRVTDNTIVLLCELYGLNFSADLFESLKDTVKIHDLAMTVPDKQTLNRLGENDIALLSFGIGKCLFAGSGGMVLTNNDSFADFFRSVTFYNRGFMQALKKDIDTFLRVFVHQNSLYAFARQRMNRPRPTGQAATTTDYPAAWSAPINDVDYTHLPTAITRSLIRYNLSRAAAYITKRKALEHTYRERLKSSAGLPLPNRSVLSHFPLLVPGAISRNEIADRLWQSGYDCAKLYRLGAYITPTEFPNSHIASARILCLPLNMDMTTTSASSLAAELHPLYAQPK